MLHVVKDGKTVQSEKIVVGNANTPTPVLSADMTEIVFNPERVVPLSVIRRDVLPKLRESGGLFGGGASSILEQYQLTVKNRGRVIDPDKIDWDTVDLSKLTFVQAPGRTNILGKVQFLLPNDRDVYLHDTIISSQLTRAVRAEGQKEPRVANPEKIAALLLAESNGWSTAKAAQLAAGNKTTEVKLDKTIPVHMTYFTVVVDEQGEVETFGDVYKLDKKVEPEDAAAMSPPVAGTAPIPPRKPSLAASAH
jgi:murein L,D-transpeptidase YcbB/YkuD